MSLGLPILVPATKSGFSEEGYLACNPDVRLAIEQNKLPSGIVHFESNGFSENRFMVDVQRMREMRQLKMERAKPTLRIDIESTFTSTGKPDYLSDRLRRETRIVDTSAVSAHGYDLEMQTMIDRLSGGLILDCGAGSKAFYVDNIVNMEIVDYPSTDILGVGEELPFKDNSFDGVLSVAVLEHVRDPFRCAREIARVLKPGGELLCSVPFLQPYHGYPHHYFNATHQGLARLFEDYLSIKDVKVVPDTHPIMALNWILKAWQAGLNRENADQFRKMTVEQLMTDPYQSLGLPFCSSLSVDKQKELASATVLLAVK